MANVSQIELRSRGRVVKPLPNDTVSKIEEVDQDFVAEQRKTFREAREGLSEVTAKTKPTASELRAGRISRQEKIKAQQLRKKAAKATAEVIEAEARFEKEVAQKIPEKATEAERTSAIDKAIKEVQDVIRKQDKKIERYRQREKKWKRKDRDDLARKYDDKQDEERAYKEVYEKALGELKSGVRATQDLAIKKYFAGFTKKMARFREDQAEYSNERAAAKREWEKEWADVYLDPKTGEGFSMKPEYAKELGLIPAKFSYKENRPYLLEEYKPPTILGFTEIPDPSKLSPIDYSPEAVRKYQDYKRMKEFTKDRTGQIYSPQLGGYAQYDPLAQGTVMIDAPTIKEAEMIKDAEFKGSVKGIVDAGKKGVGWYKEEVVDPLRDSPVFKGYEKYVVRNISKYGTQPVFGAVGWAVKKYDKFAKDFTDYTASLGLRGREIYRDPSLKGIKKAWEMKSPSATDALQSSPYIMPFRDIAQAKRNIEKLDPEQEILIGWGGTKRKIKAGELQGTGIYQFGKDVVAGEVETAWTGAARAYEDTVIRNIQKALPSIKDTPLSKQFGQEERLSPTIGQTAKLTSEIAPYFLPGVYATDVAIRAGEATLGGEFGGEKNIVDWAVKNPIDVGIVGAYGAFKGFKAIKTFGGKDQALFIDPKFEKYVDKPLYKDIKFQPEFKLDYVKDIKYAGKLGIKRGRPFYEVGSKVPARQTTILRSVPTGRQFSVVDEVILTKKGAKNVFQTVKPKGVLDKSGKYVETLKISKDAKRVITIDTKTGKGTIQIIKGKKVVTNVPFQDKSLGIKLRKAKSPKPMKMEGQLKGEPGEFVRQATQTYDDAAKKLKQPDLSQEFAGIERTTKIKKGADVKKGIEVIQKQTDELVDFTKASAPKFQLRVKVPKEKVAGLERLYVRPEVRYAKSPSALKLDLQRITEKAGKIKKFEQFQIKSQRLILRSPAQETRIVQYGDELMKIREAARAKVAAKRGVGYIDDAQKSAADWIKIAKRSRDADDLLIAKNYVQSARDTTQYADELIAAQKEVAKEAKRAAKELFKTKEGKMFYKAGKEIKKADLKAARKLGSKLGEKAQAFDDLSVQARKYSEKFAKVSKSKRAEDITKGLKEISVESDEAAKLYRESSKAVRDAVKKSRPGQKTKELVRKVKASEKTSSKSAAELAKLEKEIAKTNKASKRAAQLRDAKAKRLKAKKTDEKTYSEALSKYDMQGKQVLQPSQGVQYTDDFFITGTPKSAKASTKTTYETLRIVEPGKLAKPVKIATPKLAAIPGLKTSTKVGLMLKKAFKPAIAVGFATAVAAKTLTREEAKIDIKEDTKLDERLKEKLDERLDEKVEEKIPQPRPPTPSPITDTVTEQVTEKITTPRQRIPRIPRPKVPRSDTPTEELIKQKTPKAKKKVRLKEKPEYYMPEAKRNNKWVKLAATGLTKQAAQGRGARAVDMTVAGRFRIRKVPKGTDKIVDNYFAYNKEKFRDYKIKKGKKIPQKNLWIEKKGQARIDSAGEKQGLTLAKFLRKKQWAGKKPKKKRKLKI